MREEMASAYCTIRCGWRITSHIGRSSVRDIIYNNVQCTVRVCRIVRASANRVESVERHRVALARRVQRAGPGIRVAAVALALTCAAREAERARVGRRVRGGWQGGAPVEDGDAQQLVVRARREATRKRRVAHVDADSDAERVHLHRVALAQGCRTHVARAARRRHEVWLWLVGCQPVVRVRQVSLHHQFGRVARQLERTTIESSNSSSLQRDLKMLVKIS